ncbi:MAG: dimethylarginine dimethylaminohydrolase family protein [Acidimicrobiia bacterium]
MEIAITRATGDELQNCELTHIARAPIDIPRALVQHDDYLEVLRSLDVLVIELPRLPGHPDAVFVEDTALVLPEVAVLLRPGAPSRRAEVASMATALGQYRQCVTLQAPATLDGGDVLVFGRRILVGETTRSDSEGAAALGKLLGPFDYTVETVPVKDVLHLKSAATVVDDETLIVNPTCVDLGFLGAKLLEVQPAEPQGANVVRVGGRLLADASAPATIEMLVGHGAVVSQVHVDEFAKAEGAISCKGVIFET